MALSRGGKIALGCGIAFVLGAGAVAIAVFGAAWWGINKAKQVAQQYEGDQKRTEEALGRANANPFSPPADGIIAEDRLVRFLAVRKGMYGVYLKHKDMIEAQAQKQTPDISAFAQLPGIMLELRAAKAEALANQAMSESEFNWLFGAVYRNLLVAGIAQESGAEGGSVNVSEAVRSGAQQLAEQAEQAADAAEADPNLPAAMKQQLREAARAAREQADAAGQSSAMLDVPSANLALIRKYRDEIVLYTMGGLEVLAL